MSCCCLGKRQDCTSHCSLLPANKSQKQRLWSNKMASALGRCCGLSLRQPRTFGKECDSSEEEGNCYLNPTCWRPRH
ncbi:Os01g0113950 [Oryza sativa Japonica Group]|uniref:Os01g0113950 protein n=1 Tax=Oryza sativa subsp. japonica TaxID=39947 RepID=A0A0P0UXF7_ORYSJ|nr:Os01g0113950 [Oryza sativa Japonica Group]